MIPMFTGMPSHASNSRFMFHGPGVQVVPLVPSVGPVPPPKSVVMPLVSACSACWGAMKWTWVSIAPAVTIVCSPAITSVPAPMIRSGWMSSWMPGLPALPTAAIIPCLMPMSPLTTPRNGSSTIALVMTVSSIPSAETPEGSPAMPSRAVLPPP